MDRPSTEIVERQRAYFYTHATKDVEFRLWSMVTSPKL
jgi:hypothetical protein